MPDCHTVFAYIEVNTVNKKTWTTTGFLKNKDNVDFTFFLNGKNNISFMFFDQ